MRKLPDYDALVLEGGSLRCAFTAGVLDTFAALDYRPFRHYYGVSAGSMAMTSFLSGQRGHFIELSEQLVEDGKFISFGSVMSDEGLMNLSHLAKVVSETSPIDWEAANRFVADKHVHVVTTDFETGEPHYIRPKRENWIRAVLASSTLPMITRGKVKLDGKWMFDGGYSDPIPLRAALANGCSNILVVRTRPRSERVERDTLDWFASYWFRDNHAVSGLFEKWHVMYNSLAEVLEEEAGNGGQSWVQIAPTRPLRSDGYRITSLDLRADYRHGMEQSLDWICAER
jgi:predicted patatin/cPLA2 family phospholipase